jgi:hypothetical protein
MRKVVGSWRLAVGSKMPAHLLCALLYLFLPTANCQLPTVLATPSMDDITKSFNQNMDQEPDYSKMIPWLFGVAGIVATVMYFRQRQKRAAVPRALNHPGKLVKEVVKIAELDPLELKRLKALAAEYNCTSPLTLLLCPSLLNKADEETPELDLPEQEQ